MQLAEINEKIRQAGGELWAIAPQDNKANAALRSRRNLPFPILADSDLAVIRRWGLFNDRDPKWRAIPYPAVYLIDNKCRVAWAHVSAGTRDRPTPGELLAALRGLQAADS